MRAIYISFFAIAAIAAGQSGADAQKIALADDILEAQHIDQTVHQMFAQFQSMLHQQLAGSLGKQLPPGVDQTAMMEDVKDLENQIWARLSEQFTAERLKPAFEKIYAEEFTLEELKAIRDFQRSPAGQSLMAKQGAIAVRSAQAGQDLVQGVMPEVQQMTQEWAAKMKKKYGGQ